MVILITNNAFGVACRVQHPARFEVTTIGCAWKCILGRVQTLKGLFCK
jgi:hypothetical protein